MNVIPRIRKFVSSATATLLSVGVLISFAVVAIWLHIAGHGKYFMLAAGPLMLIQALPVLKEGFAAEWTEDGQKVRRPTPERRPRHPIFRALNMVVLLLFVVGIVVWFGASFVEDSNPVFTRENFWLLLVLGIISQLALTQLEQWWDVTNEERLRSDV